jgi:hypothetical protein
LIVVHGISLIIWLGLKQAQTAFRSTIISQALFFKNKHGQPMRHRFWITFTGVKYVVFDYRLAAQWDVTVDCCSELGRNAGTIFMNLPTSGFRLAILDP